MRKQIKKILREQQDFSFTDDIPQGMPRDDVKKALGGELSYGVEIPERLIDLIYSFQLYDTQQIKNLKTILVDMFDTSNQMFWHEGEQLGRSEMEVEYDKLYDEYSDYKAEMEENVDKSFDEGYDYAIEHLEDRYDEGVIDGKELGYEEGYEKAVQEFYEDYEDIEGNPYNPKDYDGGFDE